MARTVVAGTSCRCRGGTWCRRSWSTCAPRRERAGVRRSRCPRICLASDSSCTRSRSGSRAPCDTNCSSGRCCGGTSTSSRGCGSSGTRRPCDHPGGHGMPSSSNRYRGARSSSSWWSCDTRCTIRRGVPTAWRGTKRSSPWRSGARTSSSCRRSCGKRRTIRRGVRYGLAWHEVQLDPLPGCENAQLRPGLGWHDVQAPDLWLAGRAWQGVQLPEEGCAYAQLLPGL